MDPSLYYVLMRARSDPTLVHILRVADGEAVHVAQVVQAPDQPDIDAVAAARAVCEAQNRLSLGPVLGLATGRPITVAPAPAPAPPPDAFAFGSAPAPAPAEAAE